VSSSISPPPGFLIGHHTDPVGATGCTAVIAPVGARGGVDVRGGGPGTRETDAIGPYSATDQITAVMLCGGSAFGLAAADGAVRWCEENGRGYPTPAGPVPIVPAAVIFDLATGDPPGRPGPEAGYDACRAAIEGIPSTGAVGVGTGATVGKILGMERCTAAGVGYAAARTGLGSTVAAIAVANAFGDVIGADGGVLAGPHDEHGELLRTSELVAAMDTPPDWNATSERNTTLVCLMTDAALDKPGCARVARMASGGLARAIDPVYSDVDGDTVFCLASGTGTPERFGTIAVGTVAATVTAAALRATVESG
jgi:L-aminopeptidase/D-esterase-like protein